MLNAANEIAVEAFLAGHIGFPAITAVVAAAVEAASSRGLMAEPATLEGATGVDHVSRQIARTLLPEIAAKGS